MRVFSHSLGHEAAFPRPRLSAGFGFRKETIAGMRRNERDAPIPDLRSTDGARSGHAPIAARPSDLGSFVLMVPIDNRMLACADHVKIGWEDVPDEVCT
jgi:hypothetical protein